MPKFDEGDIVRFRIQSPNELAASRYEPSAGQYENKFRSAMVNDPIDFAPDRPAAAKGLVWISVLKDDEAFVGHYRVPEAMLELAPGFVRSAKSDEKPPAAAPAKARKRS